VRRGEASRGGTHDFGPGVCGGHWPALDGTLAQLEFRALCPDAPTRSDTAVGMCPSSSALAHPGYAAGRWSREAAVVRRTPHATILYDRSDDVLTLIDALRTAPTLISAGDRDFTWSVQDGVSAFRTLSDGELAIVPGASPRSTVTEDGATRRGTWRRLGYSAR
jgi:pimeloyl-ACP methyl ester carboxylesterase